MYPFVKRLPALFIFTVVCIWFSSSCQKEATSPKTTQGTDSTGTVGEDSTSALFTFVAADQKCSDAKVYGTYKNQKVLDTSNHVEISINVISKGAWSISTDTVTGFRFSGTGIFITTGLQKITLKGQGTPSKAGTTLFPLIHDSTSCSFTVHVDSSSATASNKVPIANAGVDQAITLPINTTTLKGSGTDSDGSIASYQWTRISGPASCIIVTSTQAQTDINSLEKGTYQFELKVLDDKGAIGKDTVQVLVLDAIVVPINETWSKLYGGSRHELATSIAATQDGGYIVAGTSPSNDGDVNGNHGVDDAWVFKLDASGNKQWSKLYGGWGFDNANSIIVAKDGGYIVAGSTSSTDGDVIDKKGGVDAWIFKIDATGKMLWSKTFGGSANDASYSIVAAPNSGYVIAGYTESNDGDAAGNHGKGDFWLLKIDENGNKVWSKVYGGSMYEGAYSVALASDNGYILAGMSESNDGDVSGNHGLQEGMVIKVDAGGNKQWSKLLGGTSEDILYSVKGTPDGNYIMAGRTTSSNGDITGYHGVMDAWVVKLDASGNKVWSKVYGGSRTDEANAITTTADGGYVVACNVFSNDGDVSGNHGLDDGWVIKVDSDGNIKWSKSLGGTKEEFTSSILTTSDGKYVLAGRSLSNDGDVNNNHGIVDAWVIKLKP